MTLEQYSTINKALIEARVQAAGHLAVAQHDVERQWAMNLKEAAIAADKVLSEVWMASRILRNGTSCPECGEYIDLQEAA